MPTLVLIRHGQSAWNLENRFTGWWDVPLTAKGVAEATAAGELLRTRGYDFDRVFTPELLDGVTITGRLEIDRFLLYMRACDVAVNLRHPTAGETSGTVIRLLGLGKPLIVNETGSFAEIPDDCCAKVPLDDTEEDLLVAYLLALARDEPLRLRMGENARRHMAFHHGLADSARKYADFLRETYRREDWRWSFCG